MGHVFLGQVYKEKFDEYSRNQKLLNALNNDDARNARIDKVSQLVSLNGDSGKTQFEMLLEPYVNLFECFLWEMVVPMDARDNYKEHEPDFNEWRWPRGQRARN